MKPGIFLRGLLSGAVATVAVFSLPALAFWLTGWAGFFLLAIIFFVLMSLYFMGKAIELIEYRNNTIRRATADNDLN